MFNIGQLFNYLNCLLKFDFFNYQENLKTTFYKYICFMIKTSTLQYSNVAEERPEELKLVQSLGVTSILRNRYFHENHSKSF